ncbi:MAG TPA: M20/M25/M40 family metallo-hydrolase [Anaeromyxobacter sp.]|nr:M20/M25/M40 family metallo-hydrolase [Anaeromyxobacter sp.]
MNAHLLLALALAAPGPRSARIEALMKAVDPARLEATVAHLVSFGTRHTLSDTASEARGIGAARRWLGAEAAGLSRAEGSRLVPFEDRFTAAPEPRIPHPVEIWNVGLVLPGVDPARAREAIVLTGHYDSRATDIMDATGDAPGADDDGSGVAMVLELARVMARERPAVSVYFVAVAGEEQGLTGSAHLARRLGAEGVSVLAMVGVDMAGNTAGQDGILDNVSARLFSEGVPHAETEAQRKLREALGTENDGASREWARYVKRVAERYVENLDLWVMLRQDRIFRGGDHMSFSASGFPAVRLSEAHEHFDRQHQLPRIEGGRAYGDDLAHVDLGYLAKLTRGLLSAVASLAAAPAPPREVGLFGAVGPEARLGVELPADPRAVGLVLYRRRADAVAWERSELYARVDRIALPGVVADNSFFAVATVDAEGNESLPVHPDRIE